MSRLSSFMHAGMVLATGLGCYTITLAVGSISDDASVLRKRSVELHRSIDLLNTELASLQRFERIQMLSDTTLGLRPMQAKQLVMNVDDLVARAGGADQTAVRPSAPSSTELVAYRAVQPATTPAAGLQRVSHAVPVTASLPPLQVQPAVQIETSGLGAGIIAAVESAAAAEARRRP